MASRGDTLASALLAEGVSLLGRSFKYHRPRGLLAAGVEEPNGLLTLGEGGRRTPERAGDDGRVLEGIVASRQNGWPSVDVDLMAALTACSRPSWARASTTRRSWGRAADPGCSTSPIFAERRGSGGARTRRIPTDTRPATRSPTCVVIGAGPAGLAAARAAAQAGARVLLIEQDFALGGSLLSARTDSALEPWRVALAGELVRMPNVSIGLRTTALGVYDGNTLALLERRDHTRPDPSRGGRPRGHRHAARTRHRLRERRRRAAARLRRQRSAGRHAVLRRARVSQPLRRGCGTARGDRDQQRQRLRHRRRFGGGRSVGHRAR